MLTIALPKGRLADQTLDLMEKAGYDVSAARDKSRKLILEDKDAGNRCRRHAFQQGQDELR